jgi:outer membrane protein, heavy metal efflux system
MNRVAFYIITLLISNTALSQSAVDSVLRAVKTNNKAIQSNKQYWDAKKVGYRTGLTPYDPQVEYDYLIGSPAGAGNQRDFSVTQRLDFPTTYKQKRILAREQTVQADLHHNAYRQEISLNAKLAVLELIYLNKKAVVLKQREVKTANLVQDYQKKLEKGDVIVLDFNKAKLQLLNIQNEVALNQNEREAILTRLTELNGGANINVNDTIYPVHLVIPNFEILDSLIEVNDPVVKTYEQEKVIIGQEIAVQKALNLPKIETGYHSQGILGQSYKGVHAGITVPLWENKNRVRTTEANLAYAKSNAEMHRLSHRLENKRLYDQLKVRNKAVQDYNALVTTLNNEALLEKALRLGQITVIQYFQDESYYFSTFDKSLQLELEYQKAIAQLYKFQL